MNEPLEVPSGFPPRLRDGGSIINRRGSGPARRRGTSRSGETIQEYGNSRPLNEQATEWLTPHGLSLLPSDPGGGGEFADQATNWQPLHPAQPIRHGLTFWQRVRILLPLCRRLRQFLPSPYNKAKSIFKRKLNPDFVDWLMGWPVGWSSEDRAFNAEEMALYLSRQRQCLRFLLNK